MCFLGFVFVGKFAGALIRDLLLEKHVVSLNGLPIYLYTQYLRIHFGSSSRRRKWTRIRASRFMSQEHEARGSDAGASLRGEKRAGSEPRWAKNNYEGTTYEPRTTMKEQLRLSLLHEPRTTMKEQPRGEKPAGSELDWTCWPPLSSERFWWTPSVPPSFNRGRSTKL